MSDQTPKQYRAILEALNLTIIEAIEGAGDAVNNGDLDHAEAILDYAADKINETREAFYFPQWHTVQSDYHEARMKAAEAKMKADYHAKLAATV